MLDLCLPPCYLFAFFFPFIFISWRLITILQWFLSYLFSISSVFFNFSSSQTSVQLFENFIYSVDLLFIPLKIFSWWPKSLQYVFLSNLSLLSNNSILLHAKCKDHRVYQRIYSQSFILCDNVFVYFTFKFVINTQ